MAHCKHGEKFRFKWRLVRRRTSPPIVISECLLNDTLKWLDNQANILYDNFMGALETPADYL